MLLKYIDFQRVGRHASASNLCALNIMSGGNNSNSSGNNAALFAGAPPGSGAAYHGPCPTTTFQGQNSYQPGQSPVIGFPGHGPPPLFGGQQQAPPASAVYPGGAGAAYSTFHPHAGNSADPAGTHSTTLNAVGSFGSPFRGQLGGGGGGGPYMEGRSGPKGSMQQYSEDQGIDMTLVRMIDFSKNL